MAAWASVGLSLESCGIRSADGCLDRATCAPIDGGYGDDSSRATDGDALDPATDATRDEGGAERRDGPGETADSGGQQGDPTGLSDAEALEGRGSDDGGAIADTGSPDRASVEDASGGPKAQDASFGDGIAMDGTETGSAAGDSGAPCDQQTCPNGCCNAGGCVTQTSDASCGVNGATCVDCTRLGLRCFFVCL